MDIVVRIDRMVKLGETKLAKSVDKIPGGKGANQAVTSARLGSKVFMIGKVGIDENGQLLHRVIENDNINVDYIIKDEKQLTGMAIITVDDSGNNSIIVIPGANMCLENEDIYKAEETIKNSDVIIAQFETPLGVTEEAFGLAKRYGVNTILNPAPANEIPEGILKNTDIIIPNETEAFEITKIKIENQEDMKKAGQFFLDKGVKFVIITLGEKGAAIISEHNFAVIPAYKVKAIDTTAAGDSFIGALAYKLKEGKLTFENLMEAVSFANKVSSIVVQRKGAQASIPYLNEVLEVFKEEIK